MVGKLKCRFWEALILGHIYIEILMPAIFAHKHSTGLTTLIKKSNLIKSERCLHAESMQPFKGKLPFDVLD